MTAKGSPAQINAPSSILETAFSLSWRWGWLLIGIVLVTHAIWLTRMPPLFVDEAWQSNAVWSWLKTGAHFESIHAGTLDQFGLPWLRRVVIGGLPWLAMFAMFGAGFFQARLVSLLFGAVMLVLVHAVTERMFSRPAALLTTLLLALSIPFTQAAHFARQDMMLAVFVFASFALARLGMRRNDNRLHFLAGLTLALSIDVHAYGMLLIPGLLGMYVARYGRGLLRARGAWLALAGGAIGVIYFLAVHILPSPQAYLRMNAFDTVGSRTPPLFTFDPRQWLQAIVREAALYGFMRSPLELGAFALGLLLLALRRSDDDKLLLGFTLAALATLTFISGKKSDLYAIFMYPFMLMVGVEGVLTLYRRIAAAQRLRGVARRAAGALVALLVLAMPVFAAQRYIRGALALADYDYDGLVGRVAQFVPPGSRVMGSPSWWFGFIGEDYLSTFNVSYYYYYNGLNFEASLARMRPDYVLVDDLFRVIAEPQGPNDPEEFRGYRVPSDDIYDWIEENGTQVGVVQDAWHGTITIYRINWPQQAAAQGAQP